MTAHCEMCKRRSISWGTLTRLDHILSRAIDRFNRRRAINADSALTAQADVLVFKLAQQMISEVAS